MSAPIEMTDVIEVECEARYSECNYCGRPVTKDGNDGHILPMGEGFTSAICIQCADEFQAQAAQEADFREINDKYSGFSEDWVTFQLEELAPQRVLLTCDGKPCIRSGTLNEIFAYRGTGKSFLMAALIKILIKGGGFLRFASTGGNRVLLVDGELPAQLLQARLRKLVGVTKPGQLLLRAVAKLEGHRMPLLRDEQAQDDFIKFCKKHDRTVIIFDTRSACFGYDPATEMDAIQSVNRFLIRLRAEGYTVITTHHAGKNDTQRGRTDNDDHLDLIMKLERSDKDDPLLSFNLTWEKVRYGDPLQPFSARFDDPDGWELIGDAAKQLEGEAIHRQVLEMTEKGMSQDVIRKALHIRKQRVGEIQRKAKANDPVPA